MQGGEANDRPFGSARIARFCDGGPAAENRTDRDGPGKRSLERSSGFPKAPLGLDGKNLLAESLGELRQFYLDAGFSKG